MFISTAFAGSVLGGNVNTFEPTIDAKYFRGGFKRGHVIGMHMLARYGSTAVWRESGQERALSKGRRFVFDWLIERVDKKQLLRCNEG